MVPAVRPRFIYREFQNPGGRDRREQRFRELLRPFAVFISENHPCRRSRYGDQDDIAGGLQALGIRNRRTRSEKKDPSRQSDGKQFPSDSFGNRAAHG